MTAAVLVKDLKVVRGKRVALQDFSVEIPRGTITGLLGPSGCGKTTLIRSIVGTQIVASGSVVVLGHPAGSPALRNRVGYVTQEPTIYNDLRVIDNVRYFAALYGAAADTAEQAITDVGLLDHAAAYCGNGCHWLAPWSASPTCWCSTNRPSAWTPSCASTSGSNFTPWPVAAPHCSSPAT